MTFTRVLERSGIEVGALGTECWAVGCPFLKDQIQEIETILGRI